MGLRRIVSRSLQTPRKRLQKVMNTCSCRALSLLWLRSGALGEVYALGAGLARVGLNGDSNLSGESQKRSMIGEGAIPKCHWLIVPHERQSYSPNPSSQLEGPQSAPSCKMAEHFGHQQTHPHRFRMSRSCDSRFLQSLHALNLAISVFMLPASLFPVLGGYRLRLPCFPPFLQVG
jgi:hypothetical protein